MNKRRGSGDDDEPDAKTRKTDFEEKLNLFEVPSSLKDMAAVKISIALWYHQELRGPYASNYFYGNLSYNLIGESYIHMPEERDSYYYESSVTKRQSVEKSIDELPIPPKLQTCIWSNVHRIEHEIKNWLYYHEERIFFSASWRTSANDLIDEIIWKSDGRVDYMATAKNLLESPLLSAIHKYRIMCTYCLVEEIDKVPDYVISTKYMDRVKFEKHPLIFYWNSYLKDELHEIDIGDATSFESYMLIKVDNWAAMEYFFDHLSIDEQVVKTIFFIRSYGFKHQMILLSKLNDSQQHRVFMDCAKSIIANCFGNPSSKPHAFDLWNRCKNFISQKEFSDMIDEALGLILYSWTCKFDEWRTFATSLLIEIWTTAPEELKNNEKLVQYTIEKFYKNHCTDLLSIDLLELFIMMLRGVSCNIKKILACGAQNFLIKLLPIHQPNYLKRYLENVCANDDEVSVKKNELMKSNGSMRYCWKLIKNGNLAAFNDTITTLLPEVDVVPYKMLILESELVIEFFTSELRVFQYDKLKNIVHDEVVPLEEKYLVDYKLKLIESNPVTEFFISELLTDQCPKLKELVDDLFTSNPDITNSVMLRACSMPEAIVKFYDKINEGEFNQVKNSLELLIPREDDLKIIKETLLHFHKETLEKGAFFTVQNIEWNEFLSWCSTDVSEFKQSLPLDDIFMKLLTNSIFIQFDSRLRNCSFKRDCSFDEISSFLAWYFDSPEEIKEFKLDKVFNFRRMELMDALSRKTEKYYLRAVLTWFFDKDMKQIQKFREAYPKHKITNFI